MEFSEMLLFGGSAIGGAITWMITSNQKLKEGLSDLLLKKLGRTRIKKIPLINHKLFGLLEKKESNMAVFIIDDAMKMAFYTLYIQTSFEGIKNAAKKIVELEKSNVLIEHAALEAIYKMHTEIDNSIEAKLRIPEKVKPSFNKWRAMMTNSLNESLKEILSDDLIENNYILAYRTLDVLVFYVTTLLHTGAVEMSRLNGSFKGLELKDIIK